MGDRVNEVCVAQRCFSSTRDACRKLAGDLELLVNVQRLSCQRRLPSGPAGAVVEFAQCRVAGTCSCSRIGGIPERPCRGVLGGIIFQVGSSSLREHAEECFLDAAADQDDRRFVQYDATLGILSLRVRVPGLAR